jgi:hypothetical protein
MILLVLLYSNALAGNKKDTYQVYINAPDQSIRASVLTITERSNADEDRTYFWYASNRIMETKGGYDGKLLHGDYASFYLNNNLKEKGLFKNGLKHGKWVEWFSNGKIKEITQWRNGLREGSCTSFNEIGEKVKEERYSNDLLHGTIINYENEKVVSTKKYRKGKEIIPRTKPLKQRKSRDKKQDTITKEGVNTKTPPVDKEKKSIKEKLKIFLSKRKKEKKPGEDNTKTRQETKDKSSKGIHLPKSKKKNTGTNTGTK